MDPPTARTPAAPGPPQESARRWFLGFDCATKTFAFSVSRVDLGEYRARSRGLQARACAAQEALQRAAALAATDAAAARALVESIAAAVAALDAETRAFVLLADGETVDLFPGQPDDSITMVERVRAVARYVGARVRPAVERAVPAGERLCVAIEYQMGPNAKARAVAAALITLFAEDDVVVVGPTLKNKVSASEEGRYCHFAARYGTTYAANKAHTKHNFAHVERVFGSRIPETSPPSLRGHIADSFMQVVGFLVHGSEKASSCF